MPTKFLLSACLTLAFASPSAANTPVSNAGWQQLGGTKAWTGNMVQKDKRNELVELDAIYSGTGSTAGNVVFTCTNGYVSAAIAIKPVDLAAILIDPPKSRDIKSRRADLTIDGVKLGGKDRRFLHMRALDSYRTSNHSQFVALYNSVLKNSNVTFKDRGDIVTLNLPKADDVFKDFGAQCGVGRLAEK